MLIIITADSTPLPRARTEGHCASPKLADELRRSLPGGGELTHASALHVLSLKPPSFACAQSILCPAGPLPTSSIRRPLVLAALLGSAACHYCLQEGLVPRLPTSSGRWVRCAAHSGPAIGANRWNAESRGTPACNLACVVGENRTSAETTRPRPASCSHGVRSTRCPRPTRRIELQTNGPGGDVGKKRYCVVLSCCSPPPVLWARSPLSALHLSMNSPEVTLNGHRTLGSLPASIFGGGNGATME